jgi:transcriptional regulator with XRE-family HTH domain
MLMTEPISGLGERIRQRRRDAGLSQQGLAVAAGLSISVIAQLEQGQRDDPRVSTLAAIARALGVRLDVLAGIEPAAQKKRGK